MTDFVLVSAMVKKRLMLTCMSSSWGGLEMVGVEFALECQRRNLNPLFICFEGSPAHQQVLKYGISALTLSEKWSFLKKILWFRKVIQTQQVDRIVVQKLATLKILRFSVLGLKKVQIFGFAHMILSVKKTDLFHRFVYGRLTKLIALTKSHKENLLDHLPLTTEQIEVVPNWVAKDRTASAVDRSTIPKIFTAAVASRLDPQKGQDLAIQALAMLKQEGIPLRLIIFGENTKNESDYSKKMKDLVRSLELDEQVQFTGYIENVLEAIAQADILIVPSWRETFGRVVIEAMSVGTPVVASDAGGIPDIINHDENGVLFSTKDAKSLAKEIKKLILDRALYLKIREQALLDSERYGQDRIMNELLEVIE